jgi:methyl-accepting chemotaxis protein
MTRMTEASQSASAQVARTDGVVQTVHELSQQSRILSINGSVEATRAGDAGRAFGVVSREMLELAEGARRQAAEIQGTLGGVHAAIGKLTEAIGEAGQLTRDQLGTLEDLTGVVETLQRAVAALAQDDGARDGRGAGALR